MIDSQKETRTVILTLFFGVVCIGILLLGSFLYVSIGFGNAVVDTVKSIDVVKKEWKREGVDPTDSIKTRLNELFADSTRIILNPPAQ